MIWKNCASHFLSVCATLGDRSLGQPTAITIHCSRKAWPPLISAADGGNWRSLQDICLANQASVSSASHPYEAIRRSESGSGCGNSVYRLGPRCDRARRKRAHYRQTRPGEPPGIRDFAGRPERKQREPTSRPILIAAPRQRGGYNSAFWR